MHLQINDLEIFFVLQILETTKIWNMFLKALRTTSYKKKNSQCKLENVRNNILVDTKCRILKIA